MQQLESGPGPGLRPEELRHDVFYVLTHLGNIEFERSAPQSEPV